MSSISCKCCCSLAQSCPTLCEPMDCSTSSFPVLHYLPKFAQTHVHLGDDGYNHLILYHPLLLLPSVFPSIRVFSNESALHIRWPKHWCFSISPSKEQSRLISFRIDWFDLLAVQGTFKSYLQNHISKASILWCSAFFMVQLSHPCVTTGKTIALTIWTFVSKVMSLLFNTGLSRSRQWHPTPVLMPGKSPWMEEPGRLQSMGSLRVRHDWPTSLSRIGEGNGNQLQCSCLENSRDRGAGWAAPYGVAHSWTQLKRLSSSSSS